MITNHNTDHQQAAASMTHTTVLLYETVAAVLGVEVARLTAPDALSVQARGVFVDATFGRGGHSRLLLKHLTDDSRLLVLDKDPEAIAVAKDLAAQDARVMLCHTSFAKLAKSVTAAGLSKADGIMADLGVSSPQLDDGRRGFSFMRDGAVDMRMDTTRGQSVGEWLQSVDEATLADVLYQYGEERHSRRIAKAIKQMPNYDSTLALAETIKQAHPNWQKGKHPATQSFQALRVFINNELGDIEQFLQQSIEVLAPNGRLAVISFHSLEDRLIKQFLQKYSKGYDPKAVQDLPAHLPAPTVPRYFSKPERVAPSADEVAANPRARSAWLRAARRLVDTAPVLPTR